MSLLTAPLDYTSVTTQSVLKGIDSAVQAATVEAAFARKKQEQIQQRIAGIEDGMSKLKGTADALTPRQRQVFSSYYSGYQQLVNQYAEDPSQENINKINQTIGSLEAYLNNSKGQYLSDKKSYAEVLTNPAIAQESIDVITQRQNERHGEEGLFDAVEFDPETLSVRVVDKRFGVGEKTPVQEHPLYNPTSENILLYTPKQDKPKFVDNLSYGSSKAGIFDAVPSKERKSKFTATALLELDQNPFLLYSAVVEKAARDGITEVDPQVLLTDPNYADFINTAKSEYAENAYNQAYREITQAARRRSAGTSPYSSQVARVSVNNTNIDIPLLQAPKKLVVDVTPGQANSAANEMVIDGFKILPNNGGIAVRELKEGTEYYDRQGNKVSSQQYQLANDFEKQVLYTTKEYTTFTTRIITDPQEYAGVLTALKRAELMK